MSATISTPRPGHWLATLMRRQPHQVIYNNGVAYLQRWYLLPHNRWFNIYLHRFLCSDDPTPHDHPWPFASLVLHGSYREFHQHGVTERRAGSIALRRAHLRHSVRLPQSADGRERPCTTLVVTGPRIREWGFWCIRGGRPDRFVPWREFDAGGCGESEDSTP